MPSKMTLRAKFKRLPPKNKLGRKKKPNFLRMLIRSNRSVVIYRNRLRSKNRQQPPSELNERVIWDRDQKALI